MFTSIQELSRLVNYCNTNLAELKITKEGGMLRTQLRINYCKQGRYVGSLVYVIFEEESKVLITVSNLDTLLDKVEVDFGAQSKATHRMLFIRTYLMESLLKIGVTMYHLQPKDRMLKGASLLKAVENKIMKGNILHVVYTAGNIFLSVASSQEAKTPLLTVEISVDVTHNENKYVLNTITTGAQTKKSNTVLTGEDQLMSVLAQASS